MRGLATSLALELGSLNKCKTEEQVHTAIAGIADRLIERFNPTNKPSTAQVSEIIVEEMLAIAEVSNNRVGAARIEEMADRLTRYFEVFDYEAGKPLEGLPGNPFDDA